MDAKAEANASASEVTTSDPFIVEAIAASDPRGR